MEAPCVRVERTRGEETRRRLAESDLLDHELDIRADGEWVYIPVTDPDSLPADLAVVVHDVPERDVQQMPADILGYEPTYERLGRVVLLDEDDPERATEIATAVMDSDLPVETVLNRASKVKGDFRVRDWDVLVGDGTEALHREYGCEFALDLAAVYFSPRLATERHRVVEQVQPAERVVDMFAGVGPFAIPIAKRGAKVVAADINPTAIEYLQQNAERNEVAGQITALCGDVRDLGSDYIDWADRIIMNLPHSAGEFLDTAVELAGDDCVLHYYDIQHEDDPFGPGEDAIRATAEPEYAVEVLNRHTVRSYAPHELNVCLDVRLTRTTDQ